MAFYQQHRVGCVGFRRCPEGFTIDADPEEPTYAAFAAEMWESGIPVQDIAANRGTQGPSTLPQFICRRELGEPCPKGVDTAKELAVDQGLSVTEVVIR